MSIVPHYPGNLLGWGVGRGILDQLLALADSPDPDSRSAPQASVEDGDTQQAPLVKEWTRLAEEYQFYCNSRETGRQVTRGTGWEAAKKQKQEKKKI